MPGMFGSMAKMAVRTPGGGTGYTSRRRHELLTSMGVPMDANGNIIKPGAGSLGRMMAPGAWGGGAFGGSPFAAMAGALPGMAGMFARPEAAAMFNPGAAAPQGPTMGLPFMGGASRPVPFGGQSEMGAALARLFAGVQGRVAGSTGARGPDQDPFAALRRFAGPFGNGGGPISPVAGRNIV